MDTVSLPNSRAPYIIQDFTASASYPYANCLNGVPNVSTVRALLGPGGGSVVNAIRDGNEYCPDVHNEAAIETLRGTMAVIEGLHPEYALAIRLYTAYELKYYKYLNLPFHVADRRIELLFNQRMYMRLLMKGLLSLTRVDNGLYLKRGITVYRGLKLAYNAPLKARFDA